VGHESIPTRFGKRARFRLSCGIRKQPGWAATRR